ncbi:ATP-binding protein [Streptomyces sp. 11x1]|uniref:ATP-binding protein n=1 Tax=Streptomyces sp. 11x1 TaxID=3038642 RepID=UPI00292F8E34|nr:ATP-binding protein [Streptomyces sp. 11x1]WNZ14206.1 ATP-binding protein [Streptomyces sp. 11x1]
MTSKRTDTGATGVRAKGWAHSFPVSGGVHAGRRWTRRQLGFLPWTADEPETVDSVVLAVSELLTNAHIHAHSDARLILTWDGDCLHVSVHDEDPTLPRQRTPKPGETSGRGVGIVRMLADELEVRCQRHGKTVSACFRPESADRPAAERPDAERLGADRPDAERPGTDRPDAG